MKLPGRVTICAVGTRDGFLPGQIVEAGTCTRRYPLPDGVRERIPARA
jgi:hypothetical protein